MKMLKISKPDSEQRASGLRRFRTSAKRPLPTVIARLSPRERESLEKRLSEPVEYIYHPSFRRVNGPDLGALPDDRGIRRPLPAKAAGVDVASEFVLPVTEVLTAAQERALFLMFNFARYRGAAVLRRSRGRRLSTAATRELLRWDQRAQDTRGEIVRANTSLVLAMARRSRNTGVELGELVSEGNLALLRCVDKFDVARGFKFSTYACRAILASFSRAGSKAARQRVQFPTPYDPAMERSDFLETRRETTRTECVEELKRILFDNSADLSAVERRVLSARFSLDQRSERSRARRKTLDQVGDMLGVSKERVRQIQNQAMTKLRAVLEQRLLVAS